MIGTEQEAERMSQIPAIKLLILACTLLVIGCVLLYVSAWQWTSSQTVVVAINKEAGVKPNADNVAYYLLKPEVLPYEGYNVIFKEEALEVTTLEDLDQRKKAMEQKTFGWKALTAEELRQKLVTIESGKVYVKVQILKPESGRATDTHVDLNIVFQKGRVEDIYEASWLPKTPDTFAKPLMEILAGNCRGGVSKATAELKIREGKWEFVPVSHLKTSLMTDYRRLLRRDIKVRCDKELVASGIVDVSGSGFLYLDIKRDHELK